MRGSLENSERSTLCTGAHSLHVFKNAGSHKAFSNVELFYIHAEVVISICNSGLEELFDVLADQLVSILEDRHCFRNILTSDEIEHYLNFSRGDPELSEISS